MQQAIAVYNSDELDVDEGSGGSNNIHLKDCLKEGRKNLDAAQEALKYLCAPVHEPREIEQYLLYFCGNADNPNALSDTKALCISFYKSVATFVRVFSSISQDLAEAGYATAKIAALNSEVKFFSEMRAATKKHSSEEMDIKPYEADMRHLINT